MMKQQITILKQNGIDITDNQLELLRGRQIESLDLQETLQLATICNLLYRAGIPCVSDAYYDNVIINRLIWLDPQNPFLHQVEPEAIVNVGKTKQLPALMLSTNKAYSYKEIVTWLTQIANAADVLDIDKTTVLIRATPKLDGYACYDDGSILYTRGDGIRGTDITHILGRGVKVIGTRGLGPGEIVVYKSYFDKYLSEDYENSRNFQGSVIKEQQLSLPIQQACLDDAIVFHPFAMLPGWQGTIPEMLAKFETIVESVWTMVDFDVDGVVFEVLDSQIKHYLGHTNHHHRWQIAFKRNESSVEADVNDVIPQTGKSGRITPVALLEPIVVSGATITRATVHNYGHVVKWKLGPGSKIALIRSGLVIPKIVDVITSTQPKVPTECPSCNHPVIWENDFLYCTNTSTCPAQLARRLLYFFETLNNIDGFGPKAIDLICESGIKSISEIYALDVAKFKAIGFGDGQAHNLVQALELSRKIAVEDWRFLAAFNIPFVGKGGCKLLLKHYSLLNIFDATQAQLEAIPGIGEKTATTILNTLIDIKPEFDRLYSLKFNLITSEPPKQSSITGLTLVFTGTMQKGTRELLEKQAEELGAKVSNSVTSKTDYLVIGSEPGASKLKGAEQHGTTVLNEQEYWEMLNG